MKVNVLGTNYEIVCASEDEMPEKFDDRDGEIDESIKRIFINNQKASEDTPHTLFDKSYLVNKNIRHELIHAFLFESGLAENSEWATNEEMVDWIARQFPKLLKAFKEIEAI